MGDLRPPGASAGRPRGLAWLGGKLYVADTNNGRVQKFDGVGTFLLAWNTADRPVGVDVSPQGAVYVATFDGHLMQKFDDAGNVMAEWSTGGGDFTPLDVAANGDGDVFVVDTNHHRVRRYLDLEPRLIFADGFESGDTSAWSLTSP